MSTTIIDLQGDLILIVGQGSSQIRLQVCKSVLRLASPVWAAMVSGRFLESAAKEIKMPDDDPKAMEVLLNLIHFRYDALPANKDFDLEHITALAIACDKYNVERSVRDFIRTWVKDQHPLKNGDEHRWLIDHTPWRDEFERTSFACCFIWVSWICREESFFFESYNCAMQYLVEDVAPAQIDDLPELPPGCKDVLKGKVLSLASEIVNAAYEVLDAIQAEKSTCEFDGDDETPNLCQQHHIGVIATFLHRSSLPLIKPRFIEVHTITSSVGDFYATEQSLSQVLEDAVNVTGDHWDCVEEVKTLWVIIETAMGLDGGTPVVGFPEGSGGWSPR